MAEVSVETTWDSHQCETCGSSYADGFKIFVDGKLIKELEPVAHCFNGTFWTEEDVLDAVLTHFGHTLKREKQST